MDKMKADNNILRHLFFLINHMGNCHPLHAQEPSSPYIKTVELFKTVKPDEMADTFHIWVILVIQYLKPIDYIFTEPNKDPSTFIDHDRHICVINMISDLCNLTAMKEVLTKTYIMELRQILLINFPIKKTANGWEHINRELAKEICNQLAIQIMLF